MKKILNFLSENTLLVTALALIILIPLYPKIPLFGVQNTWVYIRYDDFFVLFGLLVFGIQLLRKKATLNTPLTIPIVIFWAAGLISTIFSIVFYFTQIPGVFPHIAILNALRYIEYISLFFLAFSAVKNKKINSSYRWGICFEPSGSSVVWIWTTIYSSIFSRIFHHERGICQGNSIDAIAIGSCTVNLCRPL